MAVVVQLWRRHHVGLRLWLLNNKDEETRYKIADQAAKYKMCRNLNSTRDILVEDLRLTGLMTAGWVWLMTRNLSQ